MVTQTAEIARVQEEEEKANNILTKCKAAVLAMANKMPLDLRLPKKPHSFTTKLRFFLDRSMIHLQVIRWFPFIFLGNKVIN